MPLPKPNAGESKDDFISRCMSNDVMKSEFPDNDKRLAVCYSQWEDKDKKKDFSDMGVVERRMLPIQEMRVEEGKNPKIVGYASLFDSPYDLSPFVTEQVARGAFKDSIKTDDVRALWNHNPDHVLGRNKSGTLTLKEDDKGLYFEIFPPDTQFARDLMTSIKRKDITNNSFGFTILDEDWGKKEGKELRTLKKVKLYDVSPVAYAANPKTEVWVRSGGNVYVSGIDRIIQHFDPNPQVVVEPSNPDSQPKTVEPDPTPLISQDVEIKLNEIMKRRFKT